MNTKFVTREEFIRSVKDYENLIILSKDCGKIYIDAMLERGGMMNNLRMTIPRSFELEDSDGGIWDSIDYACGCHAGGIDYLEQTNCEVEELPDEPMFEEFMNYDNSIDESTNFKYLVCDKSEVIDMVKSIPGNTAVFVNVIS